MAWGSRASIGALVACVVAAVLSLPASAFANRMGSRSIAALQVGLQAKGLYSGTIDGFAGPGTRNAVRRLQRRAGIAVDGVPGPQTLGALGRRGRPRLGSRAIGSGARGFDVAQLQFLLAWHGFPSGTLDGGYGSHTQAAIIRFQRWAGLARDGVAGAGTIRRLLTPPRRSPLSLAKPIAAVITDGFGPRGNKFHPGVDFPAPAGTAVFAARGGRVTWAGWWPGGLGNLVSVANGNGVRTMYGHLSSVAVHRGQRVATGTLLGRVGSTGLSTGPHLHFELRLRGAAIDPVTGF
ncbi:MAG TPA: peptidoglycan DD-metalloendopeptidase family protein [Thermoleophilaceae bacterium]